MLAVMMITWRESIEAALIVGILLTYLAKIGQTKQVWFVYYGVTWAVLASLFFAGLTTYIDLFVAGVGKEIFDAAVLFVAVVVLTHMVVWMHHNAREIRGEIQKKADLAISKNKLWALGVLAFVGVFREGIETVLFLWGLVLQAGSSVSVSSQVAGGILGVLFGVLMTWLFFKGFGHLDLRLFFRVSGVMLLFIAAGMLAASVGKLIAADLLPPLINPVWDSSRLLDERSLIGSIVAGLFGYRSRPSLMEVISYAMYFPLVILWLRLSRHDLAD
jgi:high-affinity iron transporter